VLPQPSANCFQSTRSVFFQHRRQFPAVAECVDLCIQIKALPTGRVDDGARWSHRPQITIRSRPDAVEASAIGDPLPLAERLALAHNVVATPRFRALCFWNWPETISVTEATLPDIAGALQLHGGREGLRLGAQLCPSPKSKRKFFDFSAPIEIPKAM